MSDPMTVYTVVSDMARMAASFDEAAIPDMADRIDRIVAASTMTKFGMSQVIGDRLYHTTSIEALSSIISAGMLNTERYVSMSEIPLFYGDISGDDVVIVFAAPNLIQHLMPVNYDPSWADRYPDHSDYIAGEGWREQYVYYPPDDLDPDEDWDEIDEMEQADMADAAQEAFESKRDEREWISRLEGEPVPFQPADIIGVIVKDPENTDIVQQVLHQHGLDNIPITHSGSRDPEEGET